MGACLCATLACSPESVTPPDDATGSESAGGSESGTETTGVELCGNGVVDPGEACEPRTEFACDECDDDCRVDPLPAELWSTSVAPIDAVESTDAIKVGTNGTLYVRGTSGSDPWVVAIDVDGQRGLEIGPAAHGFDTLLDHSVGPDDTLALLGHVGGEVMVRRMLADGSFDLPIVVAPPEPGFVALSEVGIATLAAGDPVRLVDLAGAELWTSTEAWSYLESGAGRFVVYNDDYDNAGSRFGSFAGDGTDPQVFSSATWGLDFIEARAASVAPVLVGARVDSSYGEVHTITYDLSTGESASAQIGSGQAGLEVGPFASSLDADPQGSPIAYWGVCTGDPSPTGCGAGYNRQIGGPGQDSDLPVHECDMPRNTRVGPGSGVFMIRRTPGEDRLYLIKRAVLG